MVEGRQLVPLVPEFLPKSHKALFESGIQWFFVELFICDALVHHSVLLDIFDHPSLHPSIVNGLLWRLVPDKSDGIRRCQWCRFWVTVRKLSVVVKVHHTKEMESHSVLFFRGISV